MVESTESVDQAVTMPTWPAMKAVIAMYRQALSDAAIEAYFQLAHLEPRLTDEAIRSLLDLEPVRTPSR